MQRLVFWLAYPLLWFVSILPFKLFYMVSDVVYVLVYHVVRYRRKTVTSNLELVFPEKSSEEINKTRKKFYKHMVDMFLEMIKSISISNEELKKRFTFTNLEELQKIRKMNKSIILACGHYASYEWMNALQLYGLDYKGFGIYKKVKNRYFDKLAKDIRGRYDGVLISTSKATKTITENQEKGILGVYAMIADQSPKLSRTRAWAKFMGIGVPVFTGTEKLSRSLDMAVVYLHVEKVKRGYYVATFKPLTCQPKQEPEYEITRQYFSLLEAQIKKAPEYYLWTHKRWKHRNASIPHDAVVIKPD
ncbi:KDO2-lipid IV(A) lauroyltransferase [Salinimicrobium catena]|uniref:KDO2-lipid IV(A) lauroyltransferase n=1 Tax=Salinimicrobium catena TaxID=390640 RepID=A0A1H5LHY6_9FLAO|nr:lysophospholipid acyltransferase family protein [Salinimicrobium catena]SDL10253.1 KDO2-lipid IV(A) lauroyltransferase [Salinimicrobium catena]SEE76634.1 KDO2-lipid IV(A) lauroyltransferase [Salinimicrobium catena]